MFSVRCQETKQVIIFKPAKYVPCIVVFDIQIALSCILTTVTKKTTRQQCSPSNVPIHTYIYIYIYSNHDSNLTLKMFFNLSNLYRALFT